MCVAMDEENGGVATFDGDNRRSSLNCTFRKTHVTETELKFQVPEGKRGALRRALRGRDPGGASMLQLRAYYVDTPDRRLAGAGMALRLRRENRRWVQTLKARGEGMFSRLEHDVPVQPPAIGKPPQLDLNAFAGTAAESVLRTALGDEAPAMQVIFTTDVRRTLRLVKSGRSVIEVALDEGALSAAGASWPLCEIEFELKSGSMEDLIALARRWVARFHLWLDVRTKADRGDQLARRQRTGPVVHASTASVDLHDKTSADAALRLMVADCLAHLLPNAAEVARDSAVASEPEHLHQTRVALRRLRSALRNYGAFSTATQASWTTGLKTLFDQLGAARDRDALEGTVLPALRKAGSPPLDLLVPPPAGDPAAALRSRACNQLLLDLIGFAQGAPLDVDAPGLRGQLRQRLRHVYRQLRADADTFPTMDDAGRHRTRKRVKRMRYSVELVSAMWRPKAVNELLGGLRLAQELLGELNDLMLAERLCRQRVESDARIWFALGWIAARRAALLSETAVALRQVATAPRFWRRH